VRGKDAGEESLAQRLSQRKLDESQRRAAAIRHAAYAGLMRRTPLPGTHRSELPRPPTPNSHHLPVRSLRGPSGSNVAAVTR